MIPSPQQYSERNELVGRLLNEDLDAAGKQRLAELLAGDVELQQWYVRSLDLETVLRTQVQSLDDDDFALLEVQTALDAQSSANVHESGPGPQPRRRPFVELRLDTIHE